LKELNENLNDPQTTASRRTRAAACAADAPIKPRKEGRKCDRYTDILLPVIGFALLYAQWKVAPMNESALQSRKGENV
jgi:hypothetical protein